MILLVVDSNDKMILMIKVAAAHEEWIRKLNRADTQEFKKTNVDRLYRLLGGSKGPIMNPELGFKVSSFIADPEYITFWWIR